MPHTVLSDPSSGRIIVIHPSLDDDGKPILPNGVDVLVVEVSDVEARKFDSVDNGGLTVDPMSGAVTVLPPPPPPEPPGPPTIWPDKQRLDEITADTTLEQSTRDLAAIVQRILTAKE